MNANELRLGNILMYNSPISFTSQNVEVNIYHLSDILGETPLSDLSRKNAYQPVILTEEWLIKFGFEKTSSWIGADMQFEYIDYRIDQFTCFNPDSGGIEVEFNSVLESTDNRSYITTIQYVHQLQNLYYALTGKELEVVNGI